MKTATKVSIALSIAAVASISAAVITSEKIVKKVYHVTNRCKAKKFVNDTFDGNPKLLGIVDDLSDDELDSMMDVLGKVKDDRKKISSYNDSLKDHTGSLRDRFIRFVEEMM